MQFGDVRLDGIKERVGAEPTAADLAAKALAVVGAEHVSVAPIDMHDGVVGTVGRDRPFDFHLARTRHGEHRLIGESLANIIWRILAVTRNVAIARE